jgi:hemoglobin
MSIMEIRFKTNRILAALAAAICVFAMTAGTLLAQGSKEKPAATTAAKPVATKSLYDRLGGLYPIAAVVDDFVNRLATDSVIASNSKTLAALGKITPAGLKYHLTALVCAACGGPEKYTGKTMKDSHKDLNISEREWTAMAADFKMTLDKFKVPQKEQDELFAIVGTTKGDIVAPASGMTDHK